MCVCHLLVACAFGQGFGELSIHGHRSGRRGKKQREGERRGWVCVAPLRVAVRRSMHGERRRGSWACAGGWARRAAAGRVGGEGMRKNRLYMAFFAGPIGI